MSEFQSDLEKWIAVSETDNGAKCYDSSNSKLFNYFINLATYRDADSKKIKDAFEQAYLENPEYALKAMFYGRDIRDGGIGERKAFRHSFLALEYLCPTEAAMLAQYVPMFGRWDDLIYIGLNSCTNMLRETCFRLIYDQLKRDSSSDAPSLLAKWMPSINTSSKKTRDDAKMVLKILGYKTEKEYRVALARIRAKIGVLEKTLCQGKWSDIDLGSVPQKAFVKYREALWNNIPEKMTSFLDKVESGEETLKSDILYPYDIITENMMTIGLLGNSRLDAQEERLANALWKSLPDKYLSGENDMLIIGDSSSSMTSGNYKPMRTMYGLAIYFAERNKGIWKDKFMTFSDEPYLVELKGSSLIAKMRCIPKIVSNTDIDKVFRLLYNVAKESNENTPDLCFITDMQFDDATTGNNNKTIFEKWRAKFNKKEIRFPNVVFWNVGASNMSFQSFGDIEGLQYANGYGISVFKQIVDGIGMTQYEAMIEVLNRDAYNIIK